MTLKEKFKKEGFSNCCYLEHLAEDFAIGFADWIRVCKLKQRPYNFDNIKELLEIYKKEKELMTPQEKKELEYVLNVAVKVAVGIAILFFGLLIFTSYL